MDSYDETLPLRDKILHQVRQIVLSYLPQTGVKVFLFGSWARGEEKRSSDIDIAIEFTEAEVADPNVGNGPMKLLSDIRTALADSNVPYLVEVVHLNNADSYIQDKVREEGIIWRD